MTEATSESSSGRASSPVVSHHLSPLPTMAYPFAVPELPYPVEAGLEPCVNAQTLDLHFNKHHKGYATKLNAALEST